MEKLVERLARFQVIEERPDRDPRADEDRRASEDFGVALNDFPFRSHGSLLPLSRV